LILDRPLARGPEGTLGARTADRAIEVAQGAGPHQPAVHRSGAPGVLLSVVGVSIGGMANNPYQQSRPDFAFADKGPIVDPERRERSDDDRRRCRMCSQPMNLGYLYVEQEGTIENPFHGEDFCSTRCLHRRLNRLPNDDEKALQTLVDRLGDANTEAREAKRLVEAHEKNLERIRAALAELLTTAPGL